MTPAVRLRTELKFIVSYPQSERYTEVTRYLRFICDKNRLLKLRAADSGENNYVTYSNSKHYHI